MGGEEKTKPRGEQEQEGIDFAVALFAQLNSGKGEDLCPGTPCRLKWEDLCPGTPCRSKWEDLGPVNALTIQIR